MAHRVFITGAAGHVGGMLCDLLSQRNDVDRIIALDKAPMPDLLRDNRKIFWIGANTADPAWCGHVAAECPDVVIHAAWQIRQMYGQAARQREWNVGGSERVFDFAFATPSVTRLVHFSTVASYGARPDNTIEGRFTEDDAFRASDFRYAEEKRIVEASLERKFLRARSKGSSVAVAVIRPAAIAGPRARRYGAQLLQSALSGDAQRRTGGRLLSLLLSVIPVTARWCRQYIHEDDLADIVTLLAFGALKNSYNVFNASPQDVLRGHELAEAFHKRALRIHPQLIRLVFFLAWHGTRGRIGTPRGSWKSYAYPVAVDGSKLERACGYRYRMGSKDAFITELGRYADRPPEPFVSWAPEAAPAQ